MKKWFVLMLCLLLVLSAGCKAQTPADPKPETAETTPAPETTAVPETEETTPAPEAPETGAFNMEMVFSGTTLDGEPIDQTIFENYDLIIVNCWAEWCGPCVGEMPALERIHQEYPNVLILGVWLGDSKSGAKDVISDTGVTYPTLEPVGGLIDLATRSMYIPATYFFDKNGNEVGGEVIGSMDYDEWKTTVDDLLG